MRRALLSLGLLLVAAAPAAAHDTLGSTAADRWRSFDAHSFAFQGTAPATPAPQPLTGEGENFEIVANVPLSFGSDLELHGNLAFVGSYDEGMVIIDVGDPTKPRRVGKFDCGGGSQYDVQLRPDGKVAMLTTDGSGSSCHSGQQGSMIIDVSDPANPRELSFIPIKNDAGAFVGSHTHTVDWPYLYVNNYPTTYHKLEVFSLADPRAPKKIGQLDFGDGESSIHDSFVDHRPDGRTILYAASISATDAIDVTDPSKPKLLERVVDSEVTISHQAEPDVGRDTLVVTDEFQGGGDAPSCGKVEPLDQVVPGLPEGGDPSNIGALHFYALERDGTIGDKTGTYNIPVQQNEGGCTVHVYWMAPDQDRLVTAWYGRGIRVVDFKDPANAVERGHFIPTGANTWSAKPHNGYIFTGDINRGFDVLRYTGDGWPKTAGAAEAQRAAQQKSYRPDGSAPPPPHLGGGPGGGPGARNDRTAPGGSAAGRRANRGTKLLRVRVRAPRAKSGRVTLTLRITNRRGRVLATRRFRVRAGRRTTIKARVAGLAGRYRYTLRAGRRTLRRGRVAIKPNPRVTVLLPRGKRVVITAGG